MQITQTKWLVDIGAGPYGGTHATGGKTIATVKSYGVDARLMKVSPEELANQQQGEEAAATVKPSAIKAPRKSVSRKTLAHKQHGGKSVKLMTDLGLLNDESASEDSENDECAIQDTDDEFLAEQTDNKSLADEFAAETDDDDDEAGVDHHVNPSPIPIALTEKSISQYLKNNPKYLLKVLTETLGDKIDVLPLKSPGEVRHKRAAPIPIRESDINSESEEDGDADNSEAESLYESSVDHVDSERGDSEEEDDAYPQGKEGKTTPSFARKGLPSAAGKKPAGKKPASKTFKPAGSKPGSTLPKPKPSPRPSKNTSGSRPTNNDDLVALIKPDLKLMDSIDHSQSNPTQTMRQHVPYPAPHRLLAASEEMYWKNLEAAEQKVQARRASNTPSEDDSGKEVNVTVAWTIFEDDLVIGHMLDIRLDPSVPETEARFVEVSKRLQELNNIYRTKTSIKNMWNRVGRARSGFDERRRQGGPAATSMQGNMIKKVAKEGNHSKKVDKTTSAGTKRKRYEMDSDEYEEGEVREAEADAKKCRLSASDRAFQLGVRDRKKAKQVYREPQHY